MMKSVQPLLRTCLSGLIAVTIVCSLSACGDKGNAVSQPGQSIVKIDGAEITIHQFNLERAQPGLAARATNRQIVEGLVERQLMVSQAVKEKIDRDPAVMQALERARTQVLAQAWLDKKNAGMLPPSLTEIETFYNGNGALFAQRKRFDLRELIVDTNRIDDEFRQALASAASLDELAGWMDRRKIDYSRAQISRDANEVPAAMLPALMKLGPGQVIPVNEGMRTAFVSVTNVREAPLTLAAAQPTISQYLAAQKMRERSEAEVARLRAAAKIDYLNPALIADTPSATKPATGAVGAK
jgi:peptidyl-prolyl cis-trans isomerase C